jgi:hypothetical protein
MVLNNKGRPMIKIVLKAFYVGITMGIPLAAQIPITLTDNLPPSVNNAAKQFFRPIFNQQGSSCGNANGIGYNFTYEINYARNLSAATAGNQYPYCHTYHFLNGGNQDNGTSHMYVDALNIVKENGIPNVTDYGGFTNGYPTKWLSGYDLWYKAMQNRVDRIDTISLLDVAGLTRLKQWVFDHGNGSAHGGVANFGCSAQGWQLGTIASGVEAGKSIMTKYGTDPSGDHGQTVCGYNDSIRNDVNRDGKFTNNIDVTGDGKVDLADWEVGALYMANSWGTSFGNSGFYYCPYRLLALPMEQGGLMNGNRACIITVKTGYKPKMTLKASITHSQRNQIALSVGVATDQAATAPTITKTYKHQFNYAGGAFPMCGKNMAATIELGLDLTDLLDSIPGAAQAKFFLIIDSKGGSGTVNSLSLMDYSAETAPMETRSTQTNVPIAAKTYVSVASTLSTVVWQGIGPTKLRQPFAVRNVNGTIQVRLPVNGIQRVSLVDIRGKIHSFTVSETIAGWTALPQGLGAGIYAIGARTAHDGFWTGKVHILK